jgi:hypothetical protein
MRKRKDANGMCRDNVDDGGACAVEVEEEAYGDDAVAAVVAWGEGEDHKYYHIHHHC